MPSDPMDKRTSGALFESLLRETRPAFVRYLGRLVGDTDAEDVAQIALAKATAAADGFRGEASPRGWLFRIATNAAHDWNRSGQRRTSEPLPAEDEEVPDGLMEDPGQERRLIREEMSQCVAEVLHRLPEGYQAVLALSDCEELSDRDVAAALDLTVGATKIRLHRARVRLKTELASTCSFYRDTENILCCDRKQADTKQAGQRQEADQNESAPDAYRFDGELRHQVEGRMDGGPSPNLRQEQTMAIETLPSKQKHLIGVGAAVAAGCQPCTTSFVAAAHAAGACERSVRLSIEAGLNARQDAGGAMATFVDAAFSKPEVDAGFKAEKKQLEALIGIAAALASNTPSLVTTRIRSARDLGLADEQIRLAGQIGATARRGAEKEADAALASALAGTAEESCCSATCGDAGASTAGSCGCSQDSAVETETVRLEKTRATCSVCEEYAQSQSEKPVVVMSCEGACLRGEISRQAANRLCHELLPETTARLCLGGAFTKDGGQRSLVRNAKHVLALEGCPIRCASRMMRAHFSDLVVDVVVTDALCEFDRSLFRLDALPASAIRALASTVADQVRDRM